VKPVRDIVVLGAGTAGLLAALTLRVKLPRLQVRVVRSPDIGVIGVGEGTNLIFPQHILDYLKVPLARWHELVEPTWKLGIRFLWGGAPEFYYGFAPEFAGRYEGLSRPNAAYVDRDTLWTGLSTALMAHDKAFLRGVNGKPQLHDAYAWHFENRRAVSGLETLCREAGVLITDGTMQHAEPGPEGLAALHLESGERIAADLFIDASGFRSELLGKALGVPYIPFDRSLFCDRALIGAWPRTVEPIKPYTTCETMDAGWCWQIEHENWINRGYVFSSAALSDEAAREEYLRKNPAVPADGTRIVKFRSGRYERLWAGNVIGIGNAGGFVEPLEATAIHVICLQARTLVGALEESGFQPGPAMRDLYNRYNCAQWDDIRDFLSIHYRFNTRLDTPFWRRCREETDLAGAAAIAAFWQEHGPSGLTQGVLIPAASIFGAEGYFTLLAGQRVPVARQAPVPAGERQIWHRHLTARGQQAAQGMSIRETLNAVRQPST